MSWVITLLNTHTRTHKTCQPWDTGKEDRDIYLQSLEGSKILIGKWIKHPVNGRELLEKKTKEEDR